MPAGRNALCAPTVLICWQRQITHPLCRKPLSAPCHCSLVPRRRLLGHTDPGRVEHAETGTPGHCGCIQTNNNCFGVNVLYAAVVSWSLCSLRLILMHSSHCTAHTPARRVFVHINSHIVGRSSCAIARRSSTNRDLVPWLLSHGGSANGVELAYAHTADGLVERTLRASRVGLQHPLARMVQQEQNHSPLSMMHVTCTGGSAWRDPRQRPYRLSAALHRRPAPAAAAAAAAGAKGGWQQPWRLAIQDGHPGAWHRPCVYSYTPA
jgi:hypothetical protein